MNLFHESQRWAFVVNPSLLFPIPTLNLKLCASYWSQFLVSCPSLFSPLCLSLAPLHWCYTTCCHYTFQCLSVTIWLLFESLWAWPEKRRWKPTCCFTGVVSVNAQFWAFCGSHAAPWVHWQVKFLLLPQEFTTELGPLIYVNRSVSWGFWTKVQFSCPRE